MDANALGDLESQLDPKSPANRIDIMRTEARWANSQLFDRMTGWGHVFLASLTAVCALALYVLLAGVGVNRWIRSIISGLVPALGCRSVFLHVLRQNWFPGLLRSNSTSVGDQDNTNN